MRDWSGDLTVDGNPDSQRPTVLPGADQGQRLIGRRRGDGLVGIEFPVTSKPSLLYVYEACSFSDGVEVARQIATFSQASRRTLDASKTRLNDIRPSHA